MLGSCTLYGTRIFLLTDASTSVNYSGMELYIFNIETSHWMKVNYEFGKALPPISFHTTCLYKYLLCITILIFEKFLGSLWRKFKNKGWRL